MSAIRIKFLEGPRSSEPDMVFEGLSQIVIGRAVDCHVLLPMPEVSHQHASLVHRHGQWSVVDSSRTGTWVNGRRVTGEHPLSTGDTLTIGSQRLLVEVPPEPTPRREGRNRSLPGVFASAQVDSSTATRQVPRAARRGPAARDIREVVAGVPNGDLPGPESLDDMPRSVLLYWYLHAWRLLQRASAGADRRGARDDASRWSSVEVDRLKQRLEEALTREKQYKAQVASLQQALEARSEPRADGGGASGDIAAQVPQEQLVELKSALRDFQGLVNQLADLLDAGTLASSGAGDVMSEMTGLLVSMEYLIDSILPGEG